METTVETPVNNDKLNQLLGKMVGDLGAAVNGALVVLGDKLGLYKALQKEGPMNAKALWNATCRNGCRLKRHRAMCSTTPTRPLFRSALNRPWFLLTTKAR